MTTSFKIINDSVETHPDGSPNKKVLIVSQYTKPNLILRQIVLVPGQTSETLYVWDDTSFSIEEANKDDLL